MSFLELSSVMIRKNLYTLGIRQLRLGIIPEHSRAAKPFHMMPVLS